METNSKSNANLQQKTDIEQQFLQLLLQLLLLLSELLFLFLQMRPRGVVSRGLLAPPLWLIWFRWAPIFDHFSGHVFFTKNQPKKFKKRVPKGTLFCDFFGSRTLKAKSQFLKDLTMILTLFQATQGPTICKKRTQKRHPKKRQRSTPKRQKITPKRLPNG